MRLEPNALLAVTTGCSLGVLIGSAAIFGAPGLLLKYVIIAVIVTAAFPPLNAIMRRRMGLPTTKIITLESERSAMWATLYPAMITLLAIVPLIFSGRDYGILIIVGAGWFGGTISSALLERKESH